MADRSPRPGSLVVPWTNDPLGADAPSERDVPDRRDGRVYLSDADTQLAVEVALATGRPLLLRGAPGSGKSSLAAFVARKLDWRYFEHVVTSATRAEDLLWHYDAVSRLSDAQVRRADDPPPAIAKYIEPGVLWWVLDRESAMRRGAAEPPLPLAHEPNAELNAGRDPDRAVVLIDELDKADPAVPNGLLVPLGSTRFRIAETGAEISRPAPINTDSDEEPASRLLIVITTNEERELPPAFVRRCVVHTIAHPSAERLVKIARLHLPKAWFTKRFQALCLDIATHLVEVRSRAEIMATRPPSIAEYLDAVRACRDLRVDIRSSRWAAVSRMTLEKDDRLAKDEWASEP